MPYKCPYLFFGCLKGGHESADCPSPRSVSAKQCYGCGGIGHILSDCPTIRMAAQATTGVPANTKCFVSRPFFSYLLVVMEIIYSFSCLAKTSHTGSELRPLRAHVQILSFSRSRTPPCRTSGGFGCTHTMLQMQWHQPLCERLYGSSLRISTAGNGEYDAEDMLQVPKGGSCEFDNQRPRGIPYLTHT